VSDRRLAARRARLEPLLSAAQSLRDAESERGALARTRLVASTGLSPQGVDFALQRCLEANPSEAELLALLAATPEVPRANVLLSANVFVAAHRAIAIALAASERVFVRPSRREPALAELLWEAAPASFQLRSELELEPGDHLWAYGSDETLAHIARSTPPAVTLHAHGTGFGLAVLGNARASATELEFGLLGLAEDIALFDQRGCLSPRVLLVAGDLGRALEIARELATILEQLELRIPRGRLSAEEAAELSLYRDSANYAGELFSAGLGFVSVSPSEQLMLPPVGRNLHVIATENPLALIANLAPLITSCAVEGDPALRAALEHALPSARSSRFGYMQRPPFDGPVDRRKWPSTPLPT
jgi:hypothetical protein